MSTRFYEMEIAGCKRKLPICSVSDKLDIAAFIMFSDVEITTKSAKQLLKKVPKFDYILTAEAKGIPLAYEMARQSKTDYLVARKGIKVYTTNPVSIEVKSITTSEVQMLHLADYEAERIRGKRVLIADDVISTGESLIAIEKLAEAAGAKVVGKCAVLAEGDAADRADIIFLEKLPLFFKD